MTGVEAIFYAMFLSKMKSPIITDYAAAAEHRNKNITVVGQYLEYHEDINKNKKEDVNCGKQN
jgi:hypothetical protein